MDEVRREQLLDNWNDETDAPETQEWRDDLTPEELEYVDRLDNNFVTGDTTRDIRAMIDDVTDFTARAYGIPPVLLSGSVQNVDSATDQFLTFCVDPLADALQEEINRKRNGLEGLRRGDFVQFDTGRIKHIDLLDAAGSIDKLVGSGVECVNDIRALLGQPLINEEWAWKHFITKNYAEIEKVLAEMGVGEPTE